MLRRFEFLGRVHKDYTKTLYTPGIERCEGTLSAKGEIGKMKKTYIKITVLICALIMVAIALGGILFTIIQVNKANSVFNKEVSSKENILDMSDISIENDAELESTLVFFNGMRVLTNRNI